LRTESPSRAPSRKLAQVFVVDLVQEFAKGARYMIMRHRLSEDGTPVFEPPLLVGREDEVYAAFCRERRIGFAVNAKVLRPDGTTQFY